MGKKMKSVAVILVSLFLTAPVYALPFNQSSLSIAYLKNYYRHRFNNIAYTWDGTDKRAMESVRAIHSFPTVRNRWQRTSPQERNGHSQRHSTGAAYRYTSEKPAATQSTASNQPQMVPTFTDIVGDKDGFGFGAEKDETISYDMQYSLIEGEVTDGWTYRSALPLSWEHEFDLSSFAYITEATLELFTGGQGLYGPSQVMVDGEIIGYLSDGEADGLNYARLDVFDLTPYIYLLGDGNLSVSILTQFENLEYSDPNGNWGADNWILDYSQLTVYGSYSEPPAPVPEPSTILLLGVGFVAIGAVGQRKKLLKR